MIVSDVHAQANAVAAHRTVPELRRLIRSINDTTPIPRRPTHEQITSVYRDLLVCVKGAHELLAEFDRRAGQDAALASVVNKLLEASATADEAARGITLTVSGAEMAEKLAARWGKIAIIQYTAAHARRVLVAVTNAGPEHGCVRHAALMEIAGAVTVAIRQGGILENPQTPEELITATDRLLRAQAGAAFLRLVLDALELDEDSLPVSPWA
ncbi:hypothetical protein [Planomonospora sp. ID82291]|uniref:hypothetical protein n=1 Tax=Planomonospora sp. ID82291 TaxID=2738136 RepID=UPI0018C44340|nr:hypothetical protein [Planomonospora sp. ID82291]MBG0818287.1 hypothetical protein [Planomonospora sp. ID82291]